MMAKNSNPKTRVSPEFYNLVKEIQKEKFVKSGKFMSSSKITKGMVKWKGIVNLKQALVEEWQ